MEILKFDNAPQRKTRKKSSTKGLLAIAGFAAVAVLGSTLAANISLNSGSAIEFGQGVAVTSACDDNGITAVPRSVFANAAGGGTFNFATVSFSGIDANCAGKLFTLNAYDNTSATPLNIATIGATSYNLATFVFSANGTASTHISTGSYTASTIDIGFKGAQATSGAVFKITLQSSDS